MAVSARHPEPRPHPLRRLAAGRRQVTQALAPEPRDHVAAQPLLWVVAAISILVVGLAPLFTSADQLLLLQQSLYLGLLALSLNLLVATTGLISFGHAMFLALGGYLVAIPFVKLGWSPLATLALTPLVGALSALLVGFVVLRGRELYFSLLTLGVGQLIWATAQGWQSLTGGTNGSTGVFAADWLSPFLHPYRLYWFIFGIVLLCAVILYVITVSPFGDSLRAIRENRRRAEFTGLRVKRYEMTAFVIAGAFGAVAGGLTVIGETQITSEQVDWQRSALALIVALIGGTRYFLGPFVGAAFYLFAFDYLVEQTQLWETVLGIIVLVVALGPIGGLSGGVHWMLAQGIALARRAGRRREAGDAGGERRAPAQEHVSHFPGEATAPEASAGAEIDGRAAAADDPPRADGDRPPILEVKHATKAYGGLVPTNDVSLTVRTGSIHAIIGPNGAGKTTLFNVITGLAPPDSGTVTLNGEDVTGKAPWRLVKRGLGRSFQQANLFWELPALTNVIVAASAASGASFKMYGRQPANVRDRARELLGRMGLLELADVPAGEVSHGDQRSLEIAAALAVDARLLLLDEPTAGLSPRETKAAVELLERIAREEALTLLFVEHDMEIVFRIADRITVLHEGAVLAEGTPAEIRANDDVRKAYLGDEGPVETAQEEVTRQ
jgi:ABC-type branched-subunit amino acid transport system ATPase component/ABC-type branched-subunit amino acid transport system permease subunit